MDTVKIGIREFRENLAGHLESDQPRSSKDAGCVFVVIEVARFTFES